MSKTFTNEMLIEIVGSVLNDDLCDGCHEKPSPYSYENGGSCQLCCHKAAKEVIRVLKKEKNNEHGKATGC